jgi:pentatricopeptide repeat protein
MNILAYGGRHEQAEAFSKKQQLTREQYTILMKSYAKNGMASRAPSIIDVMLETEHAKPDTFSFNVAINALAESPRKDAFEKAYALFRRMEDDPLCAELGIQPDSWTYTALLKCLASKARFMEGYVTTAEEIFHEMQCRCQAGDKNIMINDVAYTLMIKIYLRAGESKKAEEVINNLKSPSERVYTDIIAYWAKEGTIEAAQQAVALLLRMKNRAKAGMANVQPSLWTYSLVIGAFANCKDPEAAKRVWSLVEDMKLEDVEMNSVIYTQLISYFCSSPAERHLLVKADLLLKQMEESKNPNLRPDYRHFSIVKKGWLEIGDIDEAEDILLRWIESTVQANHQTGTVKLVHIESIIMAWVQAGDLVRATRLLFQLDEMSCLRKIKEGPGLSIHTTLLQNWEDSLNQKKHKYIPRLKLKIADLQSISQRQNEIDEQIDRLGLNHFKRLNGS